MTNWYVTLRTSLEGTAATKSVDLPTTVEGWNEAELKEPYVITGETDLVLYYAGTLPAGKGLVLGDKKNPNGFYINYASEWVDASALGWNALCLQAVVEVEGDVPANDLAVENIAFESAFAKIGEGANATVRIANYGFADASAPGVIARTARSNIRNRRRTSLTIRARPARATSAAAKVLLWRSTKI